MDSTFVKEFADRIVILASDKNSDFVMIDGVLKKGSWKTLPNHIHIFIVDGKIAAGPKDTIGKKPDELNFNEVSKADESESARPNPTDEVTRKYTMDIQMLSQIKSIDSRQKAADKLMRKMAAEDNMDVIFLDGGKRFASPALKDLTKHFADYGEFPLQGTFEDQVIFYKDRLSLLHQLASSVPANAILNVQGEMDKVRTALQEVIAQGPTHQDDTKPMPTTPSAPQQTVPASPQGRTSKPPSSSSPSNRSAKRPKAPSMPHPTSHIRAKSSLMMILEAGLKTLFTMLFVAIAKFIAQSKSMQKSTAPENKVLYSVTNKVLSNINVSKRENFFETMAKQFQRHSS